MFKINDIEMATPTDFTIGKLEINRTGRTASGKLFNEKIAVKDEYNLNYQGIRDSKMAELLELSGSFVTFEYQDLAETVVKEVRMVPFEREQFSTRFDKEGKYWVDVEIMLEEV